MIYYANSVLSVNGDLLLASLCPVGLQLVLFPACTTMFANFQVRIIKQIGELTDRTRKLHRREFVTEVSM